VSSSLSTTPLIPDGYGSFGLCPELLTEEEAIRYLRLDGTPHPARTLKYYRDRGLLRCTVVGRRSLYRRVELERFLERQTLANRGSA